MVKRRTDDAVSLTPGADRGGREVGRKAPQTPDPERLTDVVTQLLPVVLRSLDTLEQTQRHLHPGRFAELAEHLEPLRPEMEATVASLERSDWPEELAGFRRLLETACRETYAALEGCVAASISPDGFVNWLRAMRGRARALEALYPMTAVFTPVSSFFLEAPMRRSKPLLERLAAGTRARRMGPDASSHTGILNASNDRKQRGGFSLYVPEYYAESRRWPMVVALHGGSGHGADFLWSWLREARTRGFILLCPTAQERTWSLMGPDIDADPLRRMVEHVCEHWQVDAARVLLTGMSDGATYASLAGLAERAPFTALAPLCGVFHPMNAVNGNLSRAAGKRIYLLHGALDWMFPVETARAAHEQLLAAGADVTYREVPDLPHTYPRDENAGILDWFEPSLALSPAPPADGLINGQVDASR